MADKKQQTVYYDIDRNVKGTNTEFVPVVSCQFPSGVGEIVAKLLDMRDAELTVIRITVRVEL